MKYLYCILSNDRYKGIGGFFNVVSDESPKEHLKMLNGEWDKPDYILISATPLPETESDRIKELEEAIRKHRDYKADDRCIENDDELYSVLDDNIKCDRNVGSKEEMLKNCERYITNRTEGGKWPTYKELEEKIKALEDEIKQYSTFRDDKMPTEVGHYYIDCWNDIYFFDGKYYVSKVGETISPYYVDGRIRKYCKIPKRPEL